MHLSFGIGAGLAVVYFVAAKVGLLLAAVSPSATPVWPPTGLAFAACLVLGSRVWPVIFAAAFLANITTAGSVGTSLGIAAGNTLEALVGRISSAAWRMARRCSIARATSSRSWGSPRW